RAVVKELAGVICPSEIVEDLLMSNNVPITKRLIPTGIDLAKIDRPEIGKDETDELREQLAIASDETMLLSLSMISHEKH
ncbi:glycosyltransferase family 4 protein, partial [Streptococcus suis]